MRTMIGCMVLGYVLLQFGHALDRLSTDAVGMVIGLGFGALAGVPALLMVLATAQRHQPPPPRPPVQLARFELIEDRAGRLYQYDSTTGAMLLIDTRESRTV